MDREELLTRLTDLVGQVSVDRLSDNVYRVLLPGLRHAHDSVAIGVEREGDAWIVSDGGQTSYLLDRDFDRVATALVFAGADLQEHRDALASVVHEDERLPNAILSLAYYVGTAPAIWHAMDALKPSASKPSSIDLMARELRSRLTEHLGPRSESFLQVNHLVRGQGEVIAAPLAVAARGTRRRPTLIASFIDTAAPRNSLSAAKRYTSFLLQVVRDLRVPKYVVVRGDEAAVDHYGKFYDLSNVTAVSSEHPGSLYEDSLTAISELMVV